MKENIVLVSCVSKKADQPSRAEELYKSHWFNKASAYAKNVGNSWYILSAKHGLLSPDQVVEPYDQTLNRMGAAERRTWARYVLRDIEKTIKPGKTLIFLAGLRYREYLVSPLEEKGYRILIPMKGLRIGEQMQWLNKRLEE